MLAQLFRPSFATKASRKRIVRPVLEDLEARLLLYSYTGDHFAYGNRITWSIMPDGTNLGSVTSNLVSTLDNKLGAGVWEKAITDAFAQWENHGNINVVQVSDDGEPFDAGNYQQGNPNFGDIRIGGFAQSSNVLAFTMLPPAANGGSNSGDIFFNTSQVWNINNTYDLETVAVHEIGHAVAGLGESSDPTAAEYLYYSGLRQTLAQDDVNGLQSVWGPRAEDAIEQLTNNLTSAHAADITSYINGSNNEVVLPTQDVASSTETYWFKVTTPSNASSTFQVVAQSSNLSELSPKVQIYNSALKGLSQASASTSTYGAWVSASVNNVTAGQTYYIRVSGSSVLANGTGAYALLVDMGSQALTQSSSSVVPPNTTVTAQPDQGGGSSYQLTADARKSGNPTADSLSPSSAGTVLIPLDFLMGTSTKLSTPTYKPTHVNITHPIDIYRRTAPIAQDDSAKPGQK